ncbi:MAG: hypothetical protein H6607_05950 [Flavobacteriales bacterium]|nr:hypothetical protein [Flavobacteriales bacterium]
MAKKDEYQVYPYLKEANKKRVKDDAIIMTDIDFYEYEGNPFNGYMVEEEFATQDNTVMPIKFEKEHRDGWPAGWEREYYSDGKTKVERLCFFDSILLTIKYDSQENETRRYSTVSQTEYDRMLHDYNILDS